MSLTLQRILAAIVSGLGLALTSPPLGLAWLAWFVWVPMFWATRPGDGRRNAKIAYLGGVVSTAVIYHWLIGTIQLFGGLPWVAGLLVLLLFAAGFSLVYPLVFGSVHWFRTRLGDAWLLATPALWVSFEKLDPSLFPYYQGSTQYRTEATWQFASVFGPTGLTFLIVLCNCLLAESIYRRWEQRPGPTRYLKGFAAVMVLVVGWGSWRAQAVEADLEVAPVARVALMQQDVTMEERLGASSALSAIRDWMAQTDAVAAASPDLVLWAEGAIPFDASVGGDDPERIPAFCGLTVEQYFEFMAGYGGASVLLDTLERGFCTQRSLWKAKDKLDQAGLSPEVYTQSWRKVLTQHLAIAQPAGSDRPATQCGFDMLIGAGSRSGDRVFNTAFGVSRAPIRCDRCGVAECEPEDLDVGPVDLVQAQAMILQCTVPNWTDTEAVESCLATSGLTLGALQGGYDKMIPLPFGEYVPFSDVFPSLRGSIQGVGDFKAGTEVRIFEGTTRDGVPYTYSAPICYEAILERQMWKMFQVDGGDPVDFFVNITNDAWYGVTAGPHQHAMLTASQAVMFGRPLIRSAYTGISWVVEPHGRIEHETGLYEESALVHEVRLGAMKTGFVMGGWVFPYLCIIGTGASLVMGRRRGRDPENMGTGSDQTVTHEDSTS